MSASCQSATNWLPHFGTLKLACVTHCFHALHLHEQLHYSSVFMTEMSGPSLTLHLHITVITWSCRLCLLSNVLVYLPSYASPLPWPKLSCPLAGMSLPIFPQCRRWRTCLFPRTSLASTPCRHPWFHVWPLGRSLRSRSCHALIYQKGFANVVCCSENLILSSTQAVFPVSTQGSLPLNRIHWLFCWGQTVTH